MLNKFRFLNWKVYQDATELFQLILEIIKCLPQDIKFNLGSQLMRAAFSIILNIAEGSGKNSDKELKRYFNISLGSCYELLASIDTLQKVNLVTKEKFEEIFRRIDSITNQLGGFKKHINIKL